MCREETELNDQTLHVQYAGAGNLLCTLYTVQVVPPELRLRQRGVHVVNSGAGARAKAGGEETLALRLDRRTRLDVESETRAVADVLHHSAAKRVLHVHLLVEEHRARRQTFAQPLEQSARLGVREVHENALSDQKRRERGGHELVQLLLDRFDRLEVAREQVVVAEAEVLDVARVQHQVRLARRHRRRERSEQRVLLGAQATGRVVSTRSLAAHSGPEQTVWTHASASRTCSRSGAALFPVHLLTR